MPALSRRRGLGVSGRGNSTCKGLGVRNSVVSEELKNCRGLEPTHRKQWAWKVRVDRPREARSPKPINPRCNLDIILGPWEDFQGVNHKGRMTDQKNE